MKVVLPVVEVTNLVLQNLRPCREITNVVLKLVVLALKGLAPGVQVADGVGERRLLTVHRCRHFAVSCDSCKMYASIRVSASLGPEALAVVRVSAVVACLVGRSLAGTAFRLPSNDVRGDTVSSRGLVPRAVLPFFRPWAWV